MTGWQQVGAVSGVVLAGLNAGALFAFSSFVMRGLGALPASGGAAAMQEINRYAPNPAFMVSLFGAAIVGAPLANTRVGMAAIILSLTTILITVAFHVPRNNALDALPAESAQGAEYWRDYLVVWTRGNHLRVLTSATSAACYALTLRG